MLSFFFEKVVKFRLNSGLVSVLVLLKMRLFIFVSCLSVVLDFIRNFS